MHGIYIMAIITTIAAFLIWGMLIRSLGKQADGKLLWLAFFRPLFRNRWHFI